VAAGGPVLALLRGDHRLSDAKLAAIVGPFRAAMPAEIVEWFGAEAGSLGPVGVTGMPILMDRALAGRRNLIAGANRDDYHLRHVTPGEDFQAEVHDLRLAVPGDRCERCGGTMAVRTAIELGRATLNPERILAAAAEQSRDQDGMALPPAIAPFHVLITPVNAKDPVQMNAARRIYEQCLASGIDALLDDRDERPGVKFKDADLIGVPWRVTAGKKLASGMLELFERKTRRVRDFEVGGVLDALPR
jgi:prolyl-tRNA synthetase